jgi:hypothetical protein
MELIKDTISVVIKALELKRLGVNGEGPEEWLKKVLTKKELRHIKFNYFKKGVIGLNVDSSSWLYNFTLQKDVLLAKLNRQSSAVKGIRFSLGEIK